MIIRDGFVTNSSSTNFMIISKEELSSDYLLEKLGFRKGSSISAAAFSLVDDIVSATKSGVRWFEVDQINYENILKISGKRVLKSSKRCRKRAITLISVTPILMTIT